MRTLGERCLGITDVPSQHVVMRKVFPVSCCGPAWDGRDQARHKHYDGGVTHADRGPRPDRCHRITYCWLGHIGYFGPP
jgi:hypothetical protein